MWENSCFNAYLADNGANFSHSCRMALTYYLDLGVWKRTFCAFAYMFAGVMITNPVIGVTKITVPGGHVLDRTGSEGTFRYDTDKRSYYIYGVSSEEPEEQTDIGSLYTGCITGYKISAFHTKEKLPYKSLRTLEQEYHLIRDGDSFITYLGGNRYVAIKDSSLMDSIARTHSRQMSDRYRNLARDFRYCLVLKRGWNEDGMQEEVCLQEPKRSRLEESTATLEDLESADGDPSHDLCYDPDLEDF